MCPQDPEHRKLDSMGATVDLTRPRMLPIQILDYGAGFLLAASRCGLDAAAYRRARPRSRTALARFAHKLVADGQVEPSTVPVTFPLDGPFEDHIFISRRCRPPDTTRGRFGSPGERVVPSEFVDIGSGRRVAQPTAHGVTPIIVHIAALDDVIASKQWANRPKDPEALHELEALRGRSVPHGRFLA
ncbi:MAG: hypothetical protein J2P58_02185 [Acidimicrobiaceae bacterium]|nr:hypothetical protein [Acidimicrobiaceae bacterium]